MCTGAEAGLIMAAAGTATGAANQYAANRSQDKAAAAGIRRQAELQRQASGRAMQHVNEFGRSTPQAEEAQSLEGFMNALRASQASTEGSLQPVGAANQRFAEDVTAGRGQIGQESGARAGRMAVLDAPMLQRLREGQQFNTAAGDIGELSRQSTAEDFLTRMRVASRQPNPWVGAAGNIMQGVGGAMAMMPPAGAAPAAGLAGAPTTAAAVSPQGMSTDFLARLRAQQNPFSALGGR
jgi:hypothetical protein